MTDACGACGAEVSDAFICARCTRQTRHHLEDLPEHALQLHVALQRMTRMGPVNDGGAASDPALSWQGIGDQFLDDVARYVKDHPIARPYNQLAGNLLRELRGLLMRWAWVEETRDVPVNNTIPTLSAFLVRHLGDITRDPDIGTFVRDLANIVDRIMVAVDLPADRLRFPVGPCPEDIDNRPCVGIVMASFPHHGEERRPHLQCPKCQSIWYAERWPRIGLRMLARAAAMEEGVHDAATA